MNKNSGFCALCYHYVRPERKIDPFPRLLGNRTDQFRKHIELLTANYQILSPSDILNFFYGDFSLDNDRCGLFITFDDGLSDHYQAARILAEKGINAFFFIPTCVLMDEMPANPTIIHYCLAIFGIDRFLAAYRHALEEFNLAIGEHDIPYERGIDDPWKTIDIIKSIFKYKLAYKDARNVLLHIYRNSLLADYPEALTAMHLTVSQIEDMLGMNHSIGVHSHSHPSVAACDLDYEDFEKEVVEPKRYLETTFNVSVEAFSYPFGERQDCLSAEELISKSAQYKLAFTVEEIMNTRETSPLELGRYMPMSTDSETRLVEIMESIIAVKQGIKNRSNILSA